VLCILLTYLLGKHKVVGYHLFDLLTLLVAADDVVVAISNSGLVKVWTIHDATDTRLVGQFI